MKDVQVTLTIDEANLVLKALMNMPFIEVYELIGKINEQCNKQLSNGKNGAAGITEGIMLQ
jgi:hypothetical protein